MRKIWSLIFIVLVAGVLVCFGQEDLKSDADLNAEAQANLQGKWKAVRAVYDGKETQIAGMFVIKEIEFSGKNFKTRAGDKEFTGTYKIKAEKDPMWIDLAYDASTATPFRGTSFRGLFQIDEDNLVIVTNVQRRPRELSSVSTSLNFLIEYERVKEDKK